MRSGQPAAVLDQMAVEDGYGLVVVGARGAGLSTVLLGSVATRLAAQASVPVLVVGDRAGQDTGKRLAGLVDQADPRRP
jgi:nucleotide-binding universal stress UspA family protein